MSDDRYTLRCAVYIIIIKDNKLLMFRRANTGFHDGLLTIPGGHLEKDETILQAATREALEESGLTVEEKDLALATVIHRKSNAEYVDLFFKTDKWNGEPRLTEENKSSEMVWADYNNIPKDTSDYIAYSLDKAKKGDLFSQYGW